MGLIFLGTLAQARMGVWEAMQAYFRSPIAWIDLQLFVPESMARVPGSLPMPGGLLLGTLMLINLLAAHLTRFQLTRRRIGVLILHAGLIVLIVGEFITACLAHEGLMSINVGGKSYYIEDVRTTELVVIESVDAQQDRVVSVPEALLRRGHAVGRIADARLPFDIEVVRWMDNALLRSADASLVADRGVGREAVADPLPAARGVDANQTNAPAAYVRLWRAGEPLGTWLVSAALVETQAVEVDGQRFGLALRYERTYHPYALHLLAFEYDKFVGTEIPRNFASQVRLIDPQAGVDRQVRISMNNPLRYRGSTFYQASYKPDGSGTVLQVVRNPGAGLPYVACLLVAAGMMWHFASALVGFLRRQRTRPQCESSPMSARSMPTWQRALPWCVGSAAVLLACSGTLRPMPATEYDLATFATLPVTSGGRVKPMDTAARHALLVAGGRQSVRTDDGDVSAVQFVIDLMARPDAARSLPVVRIDHPDVLALLDLQPDQAGRISLDAIEPHWTRVVEEAGLAAEIDAKRRDPYQRAVLKLFHSVDTLLTYARMHQPYVIPPHGEDGQWQSFHDAFVASGMALPEGHPQRPTDLSAVHPAVAYYIAIMTAYSEGDAITFNQRVANYDALLRDQMPGLMRDARIEVLFNRAAPFLGAMMIYVLAFVVLCVAMLFRLRSNDEDSSTSPWQTLRRTAIALVWAAFIVHTLALLLRIYLQGRPPVTNLYSSAVFVGWAAVLLGVLIERWYPIGVAVLGATVIGFITLIIAHNLGADGDTMQMMQAVLDSNFWLATHVTTITLGYSAAFLAGTLACCYILLGLVTPWLTRPHAHMLARMVYAVVCFALLLSFIGTMLGGIWADQSWGRFWGWDPKENGAALLVLINTIILHARWGGLIRERGLMVLAVAGNIVTAWAWFGTNMLGAGLHSYGFMESGVFRLLAFVISQFLLIGMGLLPMNRWRSHARGAPPMLVAASH